MATFKNTSYSVIVDRVDDSEHGSINVENGSMHYVANGTNKGLWFHLDGQPNRVTTNSSAIHGWASYADTVWTAGSPFSILAGNSAVLDNNANNKIEVGLPIGVSTFYDEVNNKILSENVGDAYSLSIRFKAKSSANNAYFDVSMDIGAPSGSIIAETKTFPKGLNTEHNFNLNFSYFTLDTFVANGASINIGAFVGDLSIYNIVYVITRTHKG